MRYLHLQTVNCAQVAQVTEVIGGTHTVAVVHQTAVIAEAIAGSYVI